MKLITISGLDGSGKTLQLHLLHDCLRDKGKKVFVYHAVKFSFASILASPFKRKINKKSAKARTSASWASIFLRKLFLIIDIYRFKFLCDKLKKQKVDYILSDRYFYDQIINIHFLEGRDTLQQKAFWFRLASKKMTRPDNSIFLEVSPLTILSRERKIEQGSDYLEKKLGLYNQLPQLVKTRHSTINGEQSKSEVHESIVKALNI